MKDAQVEQAYIDSQEQKRQRAVQQAVQKQFIDEQEARKIRRKLEEEKDVWADLKDEEGKQLFPRELSEQDRQMKKMLLAVEDDIVAYLQRLEERDTDVTNGRQAALDEVRRMRGTLDHLSTRADEDQALQREILDALLADAESRLRAGETPGAVARAMPARMAAVTEEVAKAVAPSEEDEEGEEDAGDGEGGPRDAPVALTAAASRPARRGPKPDILKRYPDKEGVYYSAYDSALAEGLGSQTATARARDAVSRAVAAPAAAAPAATAAAAAPAPAPGPVAKPVSGSKVPGTTPARPPPSAPPGAEGVPAPGSWRGAPASGSKGGRK